MDERNKLASLPETKKKVSRQKSLLLAIDAIVVGVHPPFVCSILMHTDGWSRERAETIVRWGKKFKALKR
jgi:hypothetical protein